MTNDELAEIEQRLQAASPKPWVTVGGSIASGAVGNMHCIATFVGDNRIADAEAVANAPADIAALIAEVRRLQDENEALELENAEWHIDPDSEYSIRDDKSP